MLQTFARNTLLAIAILTFISACGGGDTDTFTAGGTGFTVMSTTPANANNPISVTQKVQAVFSGDIDQTSLNEYTFQVMETEGMSIIEGKISYDAVTRTVTFEPYMPFTYATPFHLMITNKIRNASNTHLSTTTSVNFSTVAKPSESTFHPTDQATKVSPRSSVRIQFGASINFDSFDENAFTMIETATNTSVTVDVELDKDAQTAILWPADSYNSGEGLRTSTQYSYTISSAVLNTSSTSFFEGDKTVSFTTHFNTPFTSFVASNWDDYADSIKIVDDGTLIIAGETWGALTDSVDRYDGDAFIAAIDPSDGEVLDVIQFGSGVLIDENEALAIADPIYDMVTINNDIYVTGFTEGNFSTLDTTPGNRKLFVSKYTWNTQTQTISTFNQPILIEANTDIEGYAITKNSSNSAVYVIGTTTGAVTGNVNNGEEDVVVVKLDTNLTQLWLKQFGTAARDIAKGIAFDGNSVYIAGDTLGDFTNPTNPHLGLNPFLLQLDDTTGNQTATIFDTGTSSNIGNASSRTTTGIAAFNNNIYLVGTQKNSNGVSTYGLSYTSGGGTPNYAAHGDSALNNDDEVATGIYVNSSGSIYVASTRFHEMNMGMGPQLHGMTEILSFNATNFSPFKTIEAGMHASVRSMVMDGNSTMYATGYAHGHMDGVMPVGMGDVFITRP